MASKIGGSRMFSVKPILRMFQGLFRFQTKHVAVVRRAWGARQSVFSRKATAKSKLSAARCQAPVRQVVPKTESIYVCLCRCVKKIFHIYIYMIQINADHVYIYIYGWMGGWVGGWMDGYVDRYVDR